MGPSSSVRIHIDKKQKRTIMANPAAIQGGIWTMCGVALLALVTRVYSKKHYKRSLW